MGCGLTCRAFVGCVIGAFLGCLGCASPTAMPLPPDASFDGGMRPDSAEDAADAADAADVPSTDASVDAALDVVLDPRPPCTCDERACATGRCEDGACIYTPHARGVSCGESDVCAEGTCFVRFGCGDGYREREGDAREGCDDGNEVAGDGCDECVPMPFALEAPSPVAVATDPWGASLFVWTEHDDAGWAVWGRRHRRVAGFDEAFVIAEGSGFDPQPQVVALRTGWVVAHQISDEDLGDLRFTVLDHDTVVTTETQRLAFRQRQTVLFEAERGFGAAWNDEEAGHIAGRTYDELARPRAAPVTLGEGSHPAAAGGLAAWSNGANVVARRFDPDLGALVGAPVELGAGVAPSVTRTNDGWRVAYATRERDPRGDVKLVTLDADGALLESAMVASSDEAEVAPAVGALHGTTLLLFERGTAITGTIRDVGAAGWNAAPELDALAEALGGVNRQSRPAVTGAGDAFWITWMDDVVGARAFRLPVDGSDGWK